MLLPSGTPSEAAADIVLNYAENGAAGPASTPRPGGVSGAGPTRALAAACDNPADAMSATLRKRTEGTGSAECH